MFCFVFCRNASFLWFAINASTDIACEELKIYICKSTSLYYAITNNAMPKHHGNYVLNKENAICVSITARNHNVTSRYTQRRPKRRDSDYSLIGDLEIVLQESIRNSQH